MTSSGKDWCGPVHPITNLTTHTNMLFLFAFFPFPFILNMHTWTCGHTLSHTYVLFSFILQCNNRSQIQKSAGFYRKQSVCTKQKRKDIEGCDELTYSVRGKIKAVEKCIGNWGQFSGPLCHVQHTVTSSRWVFENKANGIPASLLFFFSFGEVRARGETRRRHVNPLWLRNKAADKGKMRLTASGGDYYTVR